MCSRLRCRKGYSPFSYFAFANFGDVQGQFVTGQQKLLSLAESRNPRLRLSESGFGLCNHNLLLRECVAQLGIVQFDQQIPRFDQCSFGNDRNDRALALDLALNVDRTGTLNDAPLPNALIDPNLQLSDAGGCFGAARLVRCSATRLPGERNTDGGDRQADQQHKRNDAAAHGFSPVFRIVVGRLIVGTIVTL